jgi:glycosyltransferase involved in cell wall biosynthesis
VDVSVIIPFCNEGQNVVFTVQSLLEEMNGDFTSEIILVDNQSDWFIDCSVKNERMANEPDRPYTIRSRAFFQGPPGSRRDGAIINTWFFRTGRVKYFQYDDKQGHWNAKNYGIEKSSGKYLLFLDAHCVMSKGSVGKMLAFLQHPPEPRIGGVHAYINYMLDSRSLEYRPQPNKFFGYQFCTHQQEEYFEKGKRKLRFPTKPYKVCVMSTCGMMCPRTVLEELGGWHPEFGIYCGGEGYMNFKQSTCGYHHWIHPEAICWHWAEKRGYVWNHSDFVRNEMIAAYVVGGEEALQYCVEGRGGSDAIKRLAEDVKAKCKDEREFIASRQVESLQQYFTRWMASPGVWK